MTPLKDTGLRNHIRKYGWIAILLAGLLLWIGTSQHSTAKLESRPVGGRAFSVHNCAVSRSANLSIELGHDNGADAFAPFLDIVPSQDGYELFISVGRVGELDGTPYANIGIGPSHDKGSYTMTYSETVQAYVTTAPGFTPRVGASGPINITTTLGLDTGVVDFNRAYVPKSTTQSINSMDGKLQLAVVSTDTFPSEAYVAVVPSYGPPGPLPLGHRLVGSAYSVRASGALLVSDKPMSLRLYYDEATLTGADPHTLAILAWDAYNERWDNLGGTPFSTQQFMSVATRRFTTYALIATTTWQDEFFDLSGMDLFQSNNVTWSGGVDHRLLLANTPGTGSAVSKPITPTTDFANWGSLTFTYTVDPPTTTLTMDVLSLDGSEVLTDVASGTSLAGLDPAQYPALKLRATLSSTVAGETPALDVWRLTWQVEEHRVYLPAVMR